MKTRLSSPRRNATNPKIGSAILDRNRIRDEPRTQTCFAEAHSVGPRTEMAVTFKHEPVEARLPPAKSQPAVDPKEHKKALEAISKHRKAIAWQVGRYPLEKRVAEGRTKIHLPRSYLARHGEDVKAVWPGTDINQLVHAHYFELTEALVIENPNYVTPDNIDARRYAISNILGGRNDSEGCL